MVTADFSNDNATSPMTTQLALLKQAPASTLMEPLCNPLVPEGPLLMDWLFECYTGNKPDGGLWTSTFNPLTTTNYEHAVSAG
jgi:hypothetical protein